MTGNSPRSMKVGKCELCGVLIESWCDVCERHALSHEQLVELARRMKQAQRDYYLELWPELAEKAS